MRRREFLQIAAGVVASTSLPDPVTGRTLRSEETVNSSNRLKGTRGSSGWRARIGILYPEDGALDDEYFRLVPPGVTVHVTRLSSQPKDEQEALQNAASLFKMIHTDCITYGSNGGSFWNGLGTAEKIMEQMRKGIDCPVSTATTGVMRAFEKLGIKRIAVASPYWKEINDRLKRFLIESRMEIVSFIGPDLQSGEAIFSFPPQEMYRWAVEADRPKAQAVFLPCTNLRTLEILEPLESDLRKPVISANQAMMWDALNLAGVRQSLDGFGRLFKTW